MLRALIGAIAGGMIVWAGSRLVIAWSKGPEQVQEESEQKSLSQKENEECRNRNYSST